jgi:hypothetical protein
MLLKTDSSQLLKALVEAFKRRKNNQIEVANFKINFVSAKVKSNDIFGGEIEVYEYQGIGETDSVTELVVDLSGPFEKPVQLEIHKKYIAYYPQEDERPITEFKEKVEKEQYA